MKATQSTTLGQFRVMRVQDEPIMAGRILDNPEAVTSFWHEEVASQRCFDPAKEHLVVIVLTTRMTPCEWNLVSVGTLNETLFHLREILRPVVVAAGSGFVVVHNHPSGNPSPSRADVMGTKRLKEAAELFQLHLHDHLIIGENRYYSFRETGDL